MHSLGSLMGIFFIFLFGIGSLAAQSANLTVLCVQASDTVLIFSKDFHPCYLVHISDPLVRLCSLTNFPDEKEEGIKRGECQEPAWFIDLVVENLPSSVHIDPSSSKYSGKSFFFSENSLFLSWIGLGQSETGPLIDVVLSVVPRGKEFHFGLTVQTQRQDVGVWNWGFSAHVGLIKIRRMNEKVKVVQNQGFGVLHSCDPFAKSDCYRGFSLHYPKASYQFLAIYLEDVPYSGLYFAAHDPRASSKTFTFSGVSDNEMSTLQISCHPPNPGFSFQILEFNFPVVLALFDGDWWDASQIYRSWVIGNTEWTEQGPLLKRKNRPPDWALNMTVWVNSHWQELDIFEKEGGDPPVVAEKVRSILSRFGDPPEGIGFHWYEWDELGFVPGSSYTNCSNYIACGFDSHYPMYFPPRLGFTRELKQLQESNVKVVPYINGRLFDQSVPLWGEERASLFATKEPMFASKWSSSTSSLTPELKLYVETYGSGVQFGVMCPATSYWQIKIAEQVSILSNLYKTDGVYLDQIAATAPRNCWDPAHGHDLGGGSSWVDGYLAMLVAAKKEAGPDRILLSEGNSEPFLGHFDLFLTLNAFEGFIFVDKQILSLQEDCAGIFCNFERTGSFAGPRQIAPVFLAVYGGYFVPFGTIFYYTDLSGGSKNVFAAKVGQQLVLGAQLGWFSMSSVANPQSSGLFSQLMSPIFDSEVEFLKLCMEVRRQVASLLMASRLMRPFRLEFESFGHFFLRQEEEGDWKKSFYSSSVLHGVWAELEGGFVMVLLTNVFDGRSFDIQFMFDAVEYGLLVSVENSCDFFQTFPTRELLGKFPCHKIKYQASINPRSVVALMVLPSN